MYSVCVIIYANKDYYYYYYYNQDVFIVGCTIRELCISRGEEHCLFNMYELEEFIEFLST